MATVNTEVQPAAPVTVPAPVPAGTSFVSAEHEIRIYSHSSLFYWWPVWVFGFLFALITRLDGTQVQIGNHEVWLHPGQNLGVIYTVILFLVILITNVTVRGRSSVIVILTLLLATVLFAYLGWWEVILGWLPHLAIYLNMGFYIFLSTLVFLAWSGAVFVHDRMDYWILRPGQMTHMTVIGGQEKSYDTRGMVFEKIQSDLFRHWILGLGAGDIRIITTGARREEVLLSNILFVSRQLALMQQLVSEKPIQQETIPPAAV
jgi:hypothetical protein